MPYADPNEKRRHLREYRQRPEVKAARAKSAKKRRGTPEAKAKTAAYMKEYFDRPGKKDRQKFIQQRSRNRPGDKERRTAYAFKRHLRRYYGMTVAEYRAILVKQGNACGICKGRKRLHVDHDHLTGRVRGILCSECNLTLGKLGDSVKTVLEWAEKAKTYLQNTP